MRFVFAIAAFVAAAVLIGLGIAQRTVFLEPDTRSLDVTVDSAAADYVVIEPAALSAQPGKQALTIAGDGTVYLAYGRSSDVLAWIGEEPYISVGYDAEAEELTDEVIEPGAESDDGAAAGGSDGSDGTAATETPAPAEPAPTATPEATAEAGTEPATPAVSPSGSDLWLDEQTADGRLATTIDVPEGISVLVASGSEDPVPDRVAIAWPIENSTPWVGPLLTAGTLLFLVGVGLVISGIVNHRRSRGPRRNLPKGSRGKLPNAPKPGRRQAQLTSGRRSSGGRRAMVAGVALIPALALSACSADYWPSFEGMPGDATATPTPTPTPTPTATAGGVEAEEETTEVEPAVTVSQMERIMSRISTAAAKADAELNTAVAAERFAGPALQARQANYQIRTTLPDHAAPAAIPAAPLEITLPQQSKAGVWPRTVLEVVQNGEDPTVAPTALVLVQESPRENYKIFYVSSLVPDADPPEVAPASIGAPLVTPDSKLLLLPPSQVAPAFADILNIGAQSAYAAQFDLEGMELDDALSAAGRKAEIEGANPTVTATITAAATDDPVIALATNDAGALVSATVTRTEAVRPNDGGTTGFQDGSPAEALSGFTEQSAKGVQSTREVLLLFYVPPVGSSDPVRLLGWSESLVAASEVP
ncbi:hypothetical protein GE115_02100 [Agromyces sp. CFH 90414]|uniref:DUF8094 domain-containing protein n=1 Tax=Agromyces agglutinans TaxID=2662258 RepID=A0A6I2FBY4_9MICO|nr:hypothetical protein [Agromyces agglutinans]MRG58668.1 hypothetical protein [Agromyces agglutinans]